MEIFTPEFCRKAVWIDDDDYLLTNREDFPAVNFYLQSTEGLDELADALHESAGFLPMRPTEQHPDDYDCNGWFDFYIDVLRTPNGDNAADFISACVDTNAAGYGAEYKIRLTEQERRTVYAHIDEQAKAAFGKTLSQLLDDSEIGRLQGISERNGG